MVEAQAQLSIHKQKKIKSDDFLAKPSSEALEGNQDEIQRTVTNYKDNSARFKLKKREFVQFSHIYMHRLQRMRPFIQQQAQLKWNSSKDKVKVVDKILQLELGQKCIVTGTIYKDMPLKPNVLREYAKDRAILPVPERKSFVSDTDALILEDETGRVKLIGLAPVGFVTGIPIALKGVIIQGGEFEVEDHCVAGFPPQPDLDPEFNKPGAAYVALVSGLNLGDPQASDLALSLLADYLSGFLGSHDEQEFNSSIARVILAGNNVCGIKKADNGALLKYQTKKQINEEHEKMARPIADMDTFLSMLGSSIPVDVMPGEHDPSNLALPQQPFNTCLIPVANHYGTCKPVSNPYEAEIGGRIFLGTSGQPIANAMRYMEVEGGSLEMLQRTLMWRHIAPTIPDTLAAYPYKDDDPFILDQCPHVYFLGNQSEFDSKVVSGPEDQTVRLISIPEFSSTHTIVLVDLHSLDTFPVHISVDQMSE